MLIKLSTDNKVTAGAATVPKATGSLNAGKRGAPKHIKLPATEKDPSKDLKTHEALPVKIKELELLQFQVEKAIGQENLALQKII